MTEIQYPRHQLNQQIGETSSSPTIFPRQIADWATEYPHEKINDCATRLSGGAFDGTGMDYLKSSTAIPLEEHNTAAHVLHKLELLTGETSSPSMFAQELAEQIAAMPQEKINRLGCIVEQLDRNVEVTRDAERNVISLSENRRTPDLLNPEVGFIGQIAYVPGVALINGIAAAQHWRRGADAQLNIGKDAVTIHARSYFDITGKGYFNGGSDNITVQRKAP
ncbi:hypothetical protein KA344_10795 [bacterium]|nr:hypothetical protein [bacterium]